MRTYTASELFTFHVTGNYPLDVDFVPIKQLPRELRHSGVYLLFFKQELIYIGYADKELAISRFEKQLSTVTLRGRKVSFNTVSQKAVLNSQELPQSLKKAVLSLDEDGFETSLRRIAFAEKHWPLFSRLDHDILKDFVFLWFPYDPCLTNSLPEICDEWKRNLKPICNG